MTSPARQEQAALFASLYLAHSIRLMSDEVETDPTKRLYHWLVVAAHAAKRATDAAALEAAGVTAAQSAVLYALEAAPGRTQRELSHVLRTTEASVGEMVARLLAQDLIVRCRSETDARAWEVTLSERGRRALRDLAAVRHRTSRALVGDRTPEELEVIGRFLVEVAGAFDARRDPPSS